ncbi:MAG: hypothetical protein WBS19_20915 [Candidatus Korobacteraceae bacterium]
MGIALLMLNVVGAAVYVARASHSWRIPQERELDIPLTGEPFIWAVAIAPVLAVFALVNLSWAAKILVGRQWRSGRLWLLAVLVWIVAILIDFAHH